MNGARRSSSTAWSRSAGSAARRTSSTTYDYFAGTPDYFEQDLDRYRKLTTADVQRVAQQYLADAAQGGAQRGAAGQDRAGGRREGRKP